MSGEMKQAKPRFDLIGLGECMVELYAAQPLGQAPALQRSYGGDVLNSLVAAARAGARTGFITRVGDDPFGESLLAAWRAEGVDTGCAPKVHGENGVYFISVAEDGEREFTYRRAGTPASAITPEDLDAAYIGGARCLLLSGITQALSGSAQQATLAAARIAREAGVQVAYDPNYRPRLWAARGGLAAAQAAWLELMPYVDIVLPSFPADVELLLPEAGVSPALAASSAGMALRQFGTHCRQVALKCGADGCRLLFYGLPREVPGVRGVKVVDSTGAGDAWNGVFLTRLLEGAPPLQAAQDANAAAAATLAHRGAIPPAPAKP